MGLSSAEKLGHMIAMANNNTTDLKEEVFPSDVTAAMLLAPYDRLAVRMTITADKNYYASDSFILDSPTQGILDSSTLQIDGGYGSTVTSTFSYSS